MGGDGHRRGVGLSCVSNILNHNPLFCYSGTGPSMEADTVKGRAMTCSTVTQM